MAGINITAQLQGPNNLRSFVQNIQSQLNGISANINLNISPSANSALNRLNTSIGQLNSNINTLNSSMSKIGAVSSNVTNNINNVNNAVNRVNSSISKTRGYFTESSSAMENFGQVAGLAARRFLGFSVAAGTIIKFTSSIKEGVKEALEFQNTMVKLKQVSEGSSEGIKELQSEISRLATSFGVSSKELSETALTLRQAGLSINEVKIAMESLAKSSLAPTFDGMGRTVEGVIAIMSQFKIQAKDVENALGSINAASAAFAVESSDIIEAVKRAGGAFKSVGGNLNEFIALFTAVRSTTRESADNIATGLRTIFTRLQRNDTVEALKSLQINLRYTREEAERMGDGGLENQFVGAYEAVKRLGEGLKGLRTTDPRYSAVVEQLGGYRQISRVIPLLQEATTIQKAYTVAQSGQISMTIAAATAQESYLVKIQKVKEQFLELVRTLTNSGSFKTVVDTTLTLASSLIKVTDALTPLLPMLTTLAAIKMTSGLAGLGVGFMGGVTGRSNPKLFATGGHVPGFGNQDTVDAKLTPGEYVLTRSDVQKMGGPNRIDKMRKRFAFGGSVSTESTGQTRFKLGDNIIGQIFAAGKAGGIDNAELSVNNLTEPRKNEIKNLIRGNPRTKEQVFDKRDDLTFVKAKVSSFNMQSKDKLENMINNTITPRLDRDLTDIVKNSTGGKTPRFKGGLPGSLVVKNAMNALKGSLYEGLVSAETGLDIEGETKNKNANFDFIAPSTTNFPNLIKSGILQASGSAKYIDAKSTRVDSRQILTKAVNEGLFPASSIARRMERDYLEYNTKDAMLDKNITETVAKKRHFGGILKFANGGLVPGNGNGDTEFAHMAPGSFVVTKSAVNAIGAGNLQKFAGGGEVFEWSRDKHGQSFANPYNLSLAQTQALSDKFYGNTEGLKERDILKAAGIDKIKGTQIGLKNKRKREIGEEIGRVGDSLTIPDSPFERLGVITGGGASGGGYNLKLGVAPSDLSTEQKKGLKRIGINPANVSMVADRHVISKTKQDEFSKDVMTNVSNVISNSLAKMFPGQKGMGLNNQETANISGILLGKYVSGITGIMGAGASNEDWDFKRGAFKTGSEYPFLFPSRIYAKNIDVKQNPKHINRIAGKYLNTVTDFDGQKITDEKFYGFRENKAKTKEKLSDWKKFAAGGMANGPDTVPAMLTPGEYVFNPDAVKRIGLSKLHEMNSSGKIKRFARGGLVTGGQMPKAYTEVNSSGTLTQTPKNMEVFEHNINLMMKRNAGLSRENAEAIEWANIQKENSRLTKAIAKEKGKELLVIAEEVTLIQNKIKSEKAALAEQEKIRTEAARNMRRSLRQGLPESQADRLAYNQADANINIRRARVKYFENDEVETKKQQTSAAKTFLTAKAISDSQQSQAIAAENAIPLKFRGVNSHIENLASKSLGGVKLGVGNIDKNTEDKAIQKAHTDVKNRLVEIEKQRLAVIYPNMSAEKKHTLAVEGVDKALISQRKLVFDVNGKLLGFEGSINNASKTLSSIAHAGYVSATANGASKNLTGVDASIDQLNQHSKGKGKTSLKESLKKNAGTIGFLAFGTGASYLSEAMAPKSGLTDEEIVGSKDSYTNKRMNSSALSGASIGAMTGAVLGPVGAIAGAAVGLSFALVNSMHEAELEVKKAQINIAAKNLALALEGTVNITRAKTSIQTIDEGIKEETRLNNKDFGGMGYWTDDILGTDVAGRKNLERSNEFIAKRNQIYSGQLPAFSKSLSTEAEKIGERHVGNNDIFKNGVFEQEMLKGASGLNKEMLTKISQLKGIPLKEAIKEFADSARLAARRILTEQANARGQSGFNFFINGVTKFNDAITAAAESGNKFGVALENIQNEISGSFGPRKMTDLSSGFGMMGRSSPEFTKSLDAVVNQMGEGGQNFKQIAESIDRVATELPSIMNGIFADFNSGKDPQSVVKSQLRERLGVKSDDNSSAAATYIDKVVGRMAENGDLKDINKIMNSAGGTGRWAKSITQPDVDEASRMGSDSIAKLMQIFSERAGGYNNYFKTTSLANQEQDKASSITAEMNRVITAIENEALGKKEVDTFAMNPFMDRQQRLNGGDFNPVTIAKSITDERNKIQGMEKKRDEALRAGDNQTALKFNDAIEESNNKLKIFHDALGNAAGAAKQETQILLDKVKLLQEERSQRLGAAEVMKFGSAKERQDMANQAKIAQRALDFGTENMGDKERADALSGFNRFSRVPMFRDKNGDMITGEQAKMQVINNDPRMKGVVDTPALDDAKKNLQKAYEDEIKVTNELSKTMKDLADSIKATIEERSRTQFNELAKQKAMGEGQALAAEIATKKNRRNSYGVQSEEDIKRFEKLSESNGLLENGVFRQDRFEAAKNLAIKAKERHEALNSVGEFKVNTDYNFEKYTGKAGALNKASLLLNPIDFRENTGENTEFKDKINFDLLTHLNGLKVPPANARKIADDISTSLSSPEELKKLAEAKKNNNSEKYLETRINEYLRSKLGADGDVAGYDKEVANYAATMGWKTDKGETIKKYSELSHEQEQKIRKTQDSFNAMTPQSLTMFASTMKLLETEFKGDFKGLTDAIKGLTTEITKLEGKEAKRKKDIESPVGAFFGHFSRGRVPTMAGSDVPMGIDRIPIWAAEGEIILNPKASRQRGVADLARHLNAGGELGGSHFANGGVVVDPNQKYDKYEVDGDTELSNRDRDKYLSAKVWNDKLVKIRTLRAEADLNKDKTKLNESIALQEEMNLLKSGKEKKFKEIFNNFLEKNKGASAERLDELEDEARYQSGYYKFYDNSIDPSVQDAEIRDIFKKKFKADVNFDKSKHNLSTLRKNTDSMTPEEREVLEDIKREELEKEKEFYKRRDGQNLDRIKGRNIPKDEERIRKDKEIRDRFEKNKPLPPKAPVIPPQIGKKPPVVAANKGPKPDAPDKEGKKDWGDFQAAMNRGLKKNAAAAWVAQNDPLFAEQMGMVQDASRFDMNKSAEFFKRTRIRQQLMEQMRDKRIFRNGVRKFAEGGIVPGFGNQDSVPALLTPGEIVIPKRMAQGGVVGPASTTTSSGFGGLKVEIPKEFTTASEMIASAFNNGIGPMIALSNSLNNIPKLVEKLGNIPTRIEMSIAPVNFIVTMPDMGGYTESLKKDMTQIVEKMINSKLNQVLNSSDTPVIGGGF